MLEVIYVISFGILLGIAFYRIGNISYQSEGIKRNVDSIESMIKREINKKEDEELYKSISYEPLFRDINGCLRIPKTNPKNIETIMILTDLMKAKYPYINYDSVETSGNSRAIDILYHINCKLGLMEDKDISVDKISILTMEYLNENRLDLDCNYYSIYPIMEEEVIRQFVAKKSNN